MDAGAAIQGLDTSALAETAPMIIGAKLVGDVDVALFQQPGAGRRFPARAGRTRARRRERFLPEVLDCADSRID
jgi:hypothetical protein